MADYTTFDWDDEILNDSGFTILEEGDYKFEVVSFEKGRYEPKDGSKAPACNKAIVGFKIKDEKGNSIEREENFLLYSGMEWKISEFFRSIGMKKEGEKVRMAWGEIIGKKGICHVKQVKGTGNNSNRIYNNIDKFHDYDAGKMTAQTSVQGDQDISW